jgi:hypothetical protein
MNKKGSDNKEFGALTGFYYMGVLLNKEYSVQACLYGVLPE